MKKRSKVESYLEKLQPQHNLVIVSFFVTDPAGLSKLKRQWAKRDSGHQKYLGRSKKETQEIKNSELGGSICLVDPCNLSIGFIDEINIPVATGMYYDAKRKVLYCGSGERIRVARNRRIIKEYNYHLFNDIHGLHSTQNGNLLVVSTGTDSILEFSLGSFRKPIWEWLATENGFSKTPMGCKRVIDRSTNYQTMVTTTPEHTTHINSCLNYKPNRILATLFHQGKIIEINRSSKKWKTVLGGLKSPHSIRRMSEGYIVSDTLNNRVLLLSNNFKIMNAIDGGFDWVQDALELSEGGYLIADSNNNRLVKTDRLGKVLSLYDYSSMERKVYCFLYLTAEAAKNIFVE